MTKRRIEVFSAGCPVCRETVDLVRRLACESCEVSVLDLNDRLVAERARDLGVRAVPAVVVDGRIADCCASGVTAAGLRDAGVGQPL